MFNLDTTTRSIEVLLGGAVATNQLPIVASYADSELPAYASFADLRLAQETQATNQTATNNTSVVTAVAAPGSGDQRRLKYLSVYNADTAEVTPTVRLNDNGTTRILAKPTLAVGDTLYYVEGIGFYVMDTNGAMKSAGTIPFATPSIVLGTAAAAGSGTSTIRSDATIAAFDSTVPGTSAVGDSAATGSVAFAARRDHTHGREAFATPSVVLSTAAAAGVAATLLRSDATIAAFDATVPVTQAFGDSAATGSVAFSARRDHTHGMPATPVTTLAGTAAEITASASTGAVTLSLPAAITLTDKTITGGTFASSTLNSPTLVTPALGTPASGVATNLTSLPAANLLIASQATGDLLYASSTTAWTRLAGAAAGKYLRSGGVGAAPLWSTLTLPNTVSAFNTLFRSDGTNIVEAINLLFDTVNFGIGTGSLDATNMQGGMVFLNGIAPSTSPANLIQLWAEDVAASAELRVRDEAGNVTTLSPHSAPFLNTLPVVGRSMPWVYRSENPYIGQIISVDMLGAIMAIQVLSNQQFIFLESMPPEKIRDWDTDQIIELNIRNKKIAEWKRNQKGPEPAVYKIKRPPKWMMDRGVKTAIMEV